MFNIEKMLFVVRLISYYFVAHWTQTNKTLQRRVTIGKKCKWNTTSGVL